MYLFGGDAYEIERLNVDAMQEWEILTQKFQDIDGTSFDFTTGEIRHGMPISYFNYILLFTFWDGIVAQDAMFLFDVTSLSLSFFGSYPESVYGCGAVMAQNRLFTFGGSTTNDIYFSDIVGNDESETTTTATSTTTITTSKTPTMIPSLIPSTIPSALPSALPIDQPSFGPSKFPSDIPSDIPSTIPSYDPIFNPTYNPSTDNPSQLPSAMSTMEHVITATIATTMSGDSSDSRSSISTRSDEDDPNADGDAGGSTLISISGSGTTLAVILLTVTVVILVCVICCLAVCYVKRTRPTSQAMPVLSGGTSPNLDGASLAKREERILRLEERLNELIPLQIQAQEVANNINYKNKDDKNTIALTKIASTSIYGRNDSSRKDSKDKFTDNSGNVSIDIKYAIDKTDNSNNNEIDVNALPELGTHDENDSFSNDESDKDAAAKTSTNGALPDTVDSEGM